MNKSNNCLIYRADIKYPDNCTASQDFPEYPFVHDKDERDQVYEMVREGFKRLGFDLEHYGDKNWNPLSDYIKPGNIVVIKPNMVLHINRAINDYKKGMETLITHPSVVRCVFDYVYIALKGEGTIIIGDAPIQDCDFDKLIAQTGYKDVKKYCESYKTHSLDIFFMDFRDTVMTQVNGKQRQKDREGKTRGMIVDLGDMSFFKNYDNKKRLRVTNYSGHETSSHHTKNKNEYCINSDILMADVIINIPKPKTHRIAGYTAALKNMIGINARKEFLPHHTKGDASTGGDEYLPTNVLLKRINSTINDLKNSALKNRMFFLSDVLNELGRITGKKLDKMEPNRKKYGMWYGNDTIWRTILDLNSIVYFADKNGKMQDIPQRKILHIGDMIVCGEGEGPMRPEYRYIGGILISNNPVSFDKIVVKIMGYDEKDFKVLINAGNNNFLQRMGSEEVYVESNDDRYRGMLSELKTDYVFKRPMGWIQ